MAASSVGLLLFHRTLGSADAELCVLAQRTLNGQCCFPKGPATLHSIPTEAALMVLEEQTGIHRDCIRLREDRSVVELSERGQPAAVYFIADVAAEVGPSSLAVQFDSAHFKEVGFLPVTSVLCAEGLKARRAKVLREASSAAFPDYILPECKPSSTSPGLEKPPPPIVEERLLIVKLQAGSHLFGLDHGDSDLDLKAVYIPSLEDLLLGRISHTVIHGTTAGRNSRADVDTETYSLHRFVEHAMEGAAFALDMLHAPSTMILHRHPVWDALVREKHRFYTRGFSSATSFVRSALLRAQSAFTANTKADVCDNFLHALSCHDVQTKLAEIWDELPQAEGIQYSECRSLAHANQTLRIITLCDKTLFENIRVKEALDCMRSLRKRFARKTVEWKEVSHAVRIADELQELYCTGHITLPLPNRDMVRDIKLGKWEFPAAEALLRERLTSLEGLAMRSQYPEQVDRAFWDDFVVRHIMMFHSLPLTRDG